MENSLNGNVNEKKRQLEVYHSPYSDDLEALLKEDWKRIDAGLAAMALSPISKDPKAGPSAVRSSYLPPANRLESLYQMLEGTGEHAYEGLCRLGNSLKEKVSEVPSYFADRKGPGSLYEKLKGSGSRAYNRLRTAVGRQKAGSLGLGSNHADNARDVKSKYDPVPCSVGLYLLSDEEGLGDSDDPGAKNHDMQRANRGGAYGSLKPIKRVKLPNGKVAYFMKGKPVVGKPDVPGAGIMTYIGMACSVTMTSGMSQPSGTSYSFTAMIGGPYNFTYSSN